VKRIGIIGVGGIARAIVGGLCGGVEEPPEIFTCACTAPIDWICRPGRLMLIALGPGPDPLYYRCIRTGSAAPPRSFPNVGRWG